MNKFSVTLIHGTFAEGAAWTHPEKSKLCAFLISQFGSDIEFERFDWDGSNRHKARVQASRDLLKEYRPGGRFVHRLDQPHFVIAHSHGGSAMAYALRDEPQFAQALTGVAFLSTPFIQARERLTARWVLKVLPWSVALFTSWIAVMLLLVIVSLVCGSSQVAKLDAWIILVAIFGPLALGFVFTSVLIGQPGKGLPKKLELQVREAVSELDLGALASRGLNSKTLIIRANADEASSSLGAAHISSRLLGEVPARIAILPKVVFESLNRRMEALAQKVDGQRASLQMKLVVGTVLGLLLLFPILSIIDWFKGPDYLEMNWPIISLIRKICADFVLDLIMGSVWLFLASGLISAVLAVLAMPLIIAVFRVAFGRWYLLSALFVEVSVETTPPGEWRINQLGLGDMPNSVNLDETFALAHSMSYDDPRAHRIIADWIRASLGGRPQGQSTFSGLTKSL